MPSNIFLSYARSDDEPFARQLYTDLTANGFSVWFDRVSMPSRGLTFLQEIRDAIDACERLILVVGPDALQSDYVQAEWQYALQTCKVVTPVLRLGEYTQLAEGLALSHCPDMRPTRPYSEAFAELLRILGEPVLPLGTLHGVPSLPAHFMPRLQDLAFLRSALLADVNRPTVITSARQTAALHGMGGIGKSVLAAAFAHECSTRRAFPDGIIWLTAGQQPDSYALLRQTGCALGDDLTQYPDEPGAKSRLAQVLSSKNVLIILDDIWDLRPAELLNEILGPRCRLLITTRDGGLVTALGAVERSLDVLEQEEALHLLADWSGQACENLPAAAHQVAEACGCLPFALALCGANVRDGVPWSDLLDALRDADLSFFKRQLREDYYPSLLRALKVSVDFLSNVDPAWAKHYQELAVFPIHQQVPEAAVVGLWVHTNGLNERSARQLLTTLNHKSLLHIEGETPQRYISLHDLQHDYLRAALKDLNGLHTELLAAYQEKCPQGWHTGPDDGYFFERLPYHLVQAGRPADLRALLMDYRWLEAKLTAVDANAQALVSDFNLLPAKTPDQAPELLQGALRLSAHILNRDPLQLPSQLTGRLLEFNDNELHQLLEQIRTEVKRPWLRPLHYCLDAPGGALQRTLQGHTGAVNSVTVTPDGRCAVSASWDNTLKVWDLASGECLHTLHGHTKGVKSVALTPDGRCAVSASADETLKVWDLASGECLRTLYGHTNSVNSVALTPDGRCAVSASWDKTLKVWDLASGECLHTLEGHTSFVSDVALTPDGRRAVSASLSSPFKVWDLASGECLRTLEGRTSWVNGVALTLDGRCAISASGDKTLKVWDLASGEGLCTLEGHTEEVNSVALTLDGRCVVSASADKTLKVWDLASGECLRTLHGHTEEVNSVALTPDGRCAVSASADETLKVWDLASGECLHALHGHTKKVNSVALTPDGRWAASVSEDQMLKVWDLASGEYLRTLHGHTEGVYNMALTPDGWSAVSASWDKTLKVWNLVSGECLHTLHGLTSLVKGVALTPAGRRAAPASRDTILKIDGRCAVSASWDNTLKVWDLASGECLHTLHGHTNKVKSVVLTPDGRCAVSASADETLKVWDLASGECLHTLHGHTGYVPSVALTPDGRCAILASVDGTLKVWDLASGECLHTLHGHTKKVKSVALTPDGRCAISASWDNTLKVWDLASGECLRTLEGHTSFINDMVLTSDGRRAISASWDNTLKVWDLTSGECLHTLHGHTSFVNNVALTPDGRCAVSASFDRTLKVWDLASGECLRTLHGYTEEVNSVALTPDGRCAVSAFRDNTLKVWDLTSGEILRTLQVHTSFINVVALTPDGRCAVSAYWDIILEMDDRCDVSDPGNYTLKVWDLASGECLRTLQGHTKKVKSVALTPDGRCAVSASADETLKVWNLVSGECLHTLHGHTKKVNSVALTPDGRCAVSASEDQMLKVWDLASGECLHTLHGHTSSVSSVALTPDNRCAISASADETLKVWDLASGECLRTLQGHTKKVKSVALTPDGRCAISASWDNTLKVWDLASGKCLATFFGENTMVCTSDSLSGLTLVGGDQGGTVYFLYLENVTPAPPISTAWRVNAVDTIAFGCPYCRTWSEIPETSLGREIPCPNCGKPLRLNPFTIQGDWQPVAKAWKGK